MKCNLSERNMEYFFGRLWIMDFFFLLMMKLTGRNLGSEVHLRVFPIRLEWPLLGTIGL